MGTLYQVIPHATSAPYAPVPCATGTAARTLLQVAVPATTGIRIFAWGISFAGVAPTDPPGLVECLDCTASTLAGSLTSATPDKWEATTAQASLCIGGAALTGYNAAGAATEGTLTSYKPVDIQYVHPQTGYAVWFLPGRHPSVDLSHQIRIRTTFTVSVNAIPWVIWEEPD